jgi:hypothetical protein
MTKFLDFDHSYSKKFENTAFKKLDLFPSSGQGEGLVPSQLGPLERANLNHWTTQVKNTKAI